MGNEMPPSLVSWISQAITKEELLHYRRVGGDKASESECFRKETFFEKHEVSLPREVDEIYRMPFWPQVFSTENQGFTHPPNPV